MMDSSAEVSKRDALVSTLFYIINIEITKPIEKINMPLINMCTDRIEELDSRYVVPEEKKWELVHKLLDNCNLNVVKSSDVIKPHFRMKVKITIIAAVLALLVAGITICANNNEFKDFVDDIKEFFTWKNGETRTFGNTEVTFDNDFTKYDSFEELIEDKKVDILYPSIDSEDFDIVYLSYTNSKMPYIDSCMFFNGSKITLNIDLYEDESVYEEYKNSNFDILEYNGYSFYVFDNGNAIQVVSFINGKCYTIVGSMENIKILIENLTFGGN